MEQTPEIKEYLQEMRRKGGETCKRKYGTQYYKELSKKGVEARRKKLSTSEEETQE